MINLSYGFDKVSYDPAIRSNQGLGEHLVKNNLFVVPEDMKSFVDYNKVGQLYLYTMKHSKDAGMMQVDENGCICDSHKEQGKDMVIMTGECSRGIYDSDRRSF